MSAEARVPAHLYDVVIAGGGMVGSLLAAALAGSSLKVAVIERNALTDVAGGDYDRRVSALTLASRTMLDAVGAWAGVARRRYARVSAMRVWDGDGGGEVNFSAFDIGEPCLAYIVENRVIVAALHERLTQSTNVHVLTGAELDSLAIGATAAIGLKDGRRLEARLVVAADGADSAIRERLSIPLRTRDMRQHGIVATVRTERPHQETAWQRFLPTGPLAFLPLPDPQACSIVWSADTARAEQLTELDDNAFRAELARAFEHRLGAITSASPRMAFPLLLAHAERYVGERLALIGDAAHTVHPLAGQGVNLGFLDAAALAEVLLDAIQERRDIGARHVLRRYERWRKGDNLAMIAVTGGFKYLFGHDNLALRGLRRAGLSLTNTVTPVKNFIMRQASGLAGDLPKLARRGEAQKVRNST